MLEFMHWPFPLLLNEICLENQKQKSVTCIIFLSSPRTICRKSSATSIPPPSPPPLPLPLLLRLWALSLPVDVLRDDLWLRGVEVERRVEVSGFLSGSSSSSPPPMALSVCRGSWSVKGCVVVLKLVSESARSCRRGSGAESMRSSSRMLRPSMELWDDNGEAYVMFYVTNDPFLLNKVRFLLNNIGLSQIMVLENCINMGH